MFESHQLTSCGQSLDHEKLHPFHPKDPTQYYCIWSRYNKSINTEVDELTLLSMHNNSQGLHTHSMVVTVNEIRYMYMVMWKNPSYNVEHREMKETPKHTHHLTLFQLTSLCCMPSVTVHTYRAVEEEGHEEITISSIVLHRIKTLVCLNYVYIL